MNSLIREFMEKCKTSYANGGFLTKDLNEDFAIDAFLQEKWLKKKLEEQLKEIRKEVREWDDTAYLNVQFPANMVKFKGLNKDGMEYTGEVIDIPSQILDLPSLQIKHENHR